MLYRCDSGRSLCFLVKYMGKTDMAAVISWWLMLMLLGLVFQPLSLILFSRFHDNGWIFSKTLGIAFSSWVIWYLAGLKLVKFTRFNSIVVIAVCTVLNFVIFAIYQKTTGNRINLTECYKSDKLSSMIRTELLFFVVFSAWCYLKGFNPAAYGTERFMDYAYVAAIIKSDYMPPADPWFAGGVINYYYVGQYISAFLVKLSDVGVGRGYNLMMMTLAAFGFVLPFSISYNLMRFNRIEKSRKGIKLDEEKRNFVCPFVATLSGIGVSLAGNMHFPIYKWIDPVLKRIKGQDPKKYWFADATRYIGYNPDVPDKTIHEFPSYSFVLGDLHAHVINIIFVLTVVALLLAWLMDRKPRMEIAKKRDSKPDKIHYVSEVFSPWLIVCMFFIGIFHTTNYWDFPIYFVVCGAIILFSNLILYRFKPVAYIITLLQAVAFIVVGILVSLPFTLNFDSISTAVKFVDRHTSFKQLAVLWGLPLSLLFIFVVLKFTETILAKPEKQKKSEAESNDGSEEESQENSEEKTYSEAEEKTKKEPWILRRLFDTLDTSDLFVMTIGLCAAGLVLLPETIYVVDIYGGAYQRANTMFKLVYQAFILFGIMMPYIIVNLIYFNLGKWFRRIGKVALILFCCTCCYFFEAVVAWFSGFYSTLDASAFLAKESEDDKAGIEWINENVPKNSVVVEMCGLSYTFFNRVSVFTGNPTVLGWQTHEWLWRSSGEKGFPPEVDERHKDVVELYTTTSVSRAQELINKYNIDYIYVGEAEHVDGYVQVDNSEVSSKYYHGDNYKKIATNEVLLKSLGTVHMISEAGVDKSYATYIVEVDHNKVFDVDIITAEGTYVESNPSEIDYSGSEDTLDFKNNKITKTLFTYDKEGRVIKEENYNGNTMVSCSVHKYDSGKPSITTDYDDKDNIYSFWNYREFDDYGNCTKMHRFMGDNSFWYTIDTVYNTNGSKKTETFTYADGHHEFASYEYDEKEHLTRKTVTNDQNNNVEEWKYTVEGSHIISAEKISEGKSLVKYDYKY